MPTYLGEFKNSYGTVRRYRADTTAEEEQEIIKGVLTICARSKQRLLNEQKENKNDSDNNN